jgi:hypothetical protein
LSALDDPPSAYGHDVMELEEPALGAPTVRSNERASALVTFPDFPSH